MTCENFFASCKSRAYSGKAWQVIKYAKTKLVNNSTGVLHIYYCTSGRVVRENIQFKAGSIGPTVGRANTKAENRPKECDNTLII